MDHFNRLGKAIKWLREDAELRQNEVAGKAGITKAMISSYESGRSLPTVATLDKILGALGADLFALCNALELVNGRQPQRQPMAQPSSALEALALGDMSPGEMEAFELIVGGFRRWLLHLRESASQIRR
ncbi:MAG: helix-turn-helix transcriptional regulator [Acidobacteriota bacterium]|nr:helix-turn-helix transcriptional regulator [Acidobacteriota bacterium]